MTSVLSIEIGFVPNPKRLSWSGGSIKPHDKQSEAFDAVNLSGRATEGWYHPFTSEVFRLPATHVLTVPDELGLDYAHTATALYGWLNGVQAQPAEWSYLYRTPIDPCLHILCAFSATSAEMGITMEQFSNWWASTEPQEARRIWFGALRWHLQAFSFRYPHERFAAQYTAMDACYRFLSISGCLKNSRHAKRVEDMCAHFGISCPTWAQCNEKESELSRLRNELIHEARFAGAPIGFSYPTNLSVWETELPRLVAVLLLCCLGIKNEFTRNKVSTYQLSGFRY